MSYPPWKATCAYAVQGSRVMRVQVHGSWFAVHGSRFTQLHTVRGRVRDRVRRCKNAPRG